NTRRLHTALGGVPPVEYETAYYAQPQPDRTLGPNTEASTKPGALQRDHARDPSARQGQNSIGGVALSGDPLRLGQQRAHGAAVRNPAGLVRAGRALAGAAEGLSGTSTPAAG